MFCRLVCYYVLSWLCGVYLVCGVVLAVGLVVIVLAWVFAGWVVVVLLWLCGAVVCTGSVCLWVLVGCG